MIKIFHLLFSNLSVDQRSKEDSLILFSVKDKDLFGMTSQYIAECYITFADLLASEGEQVIMNLSRPEYTGKYSKSIVLLNEYYYTYIHICF